MHHQIVSILAIIAVSGSLGCRAKSSETWVEPAGRDTLLQRSQPPGQLDIYLVGFHPMKDDPTHQIEAHHYCRQVNQDFAQCALFDANTEAANLNGIEYIISEGLFEQLPEDEKQYWHPHNYEILSGQLIAPGLPDVAEHELMKGKMNSYGKTWHTWQTRSAVSQGEEFPLGPPMLGWSFNADGEARPGLIESRDHTLNVDTTQIRAARQDLAPLAHPQRGVNAIAEAFPDREQPVEIVPKATGADQPE
jgi:hypothetical protein